MLRHGAHFPLLCPYRAAITDTAASCRLCVPVFSLPQVLTNILPSPDLVASTPRCQSRFLPTEPLLFEVAAGFGFCCCFNLCSFCLFVCFVREDWIRGKRTTDKSTLVHLRQLNKEKAPPRPDKSKTNTCTGEEDSATADFTDN